MRQTPRHCTIYQGTVGIHILAPSVRSQFSKELLKRPSRKVTWVSRRDPNKRPEKVHRSLPRRFVPLPLPLQQPGMVRWSWKVWRDESILGDAASRCIPAIHRTMTSPASWMDGMLKVELLLSHYCNTLYHKFLFIFMDQIAKTIVWSGASFHAPWPPKISSKEVVRPVTNGQLQTHAIPGCYYTVYIYILNICSAKIMKAWPHQKRFQIQHEPKLSMSSSATVWFLNRYYF